jgi:hypothetical protein
MRVPLVIKCSMAIGAVLALAACIGSGDYEGDPRSGSEMLTMYEMESEEQATNEAGLAAEEEAREAQAEMLESDCSSARARGDEQFVDVFCRD